MIELIAVQVGAKLSLIGDITAEVIEKIDDEWVKVRLIDGAGGERHRGRRGTLSRDRREGSVVDGVPNPTSTEARIADLMHRRNGIA